MLAKPIKTAIQKLYFMQSGKVKYTSRLGEELQICFVIFGGNLTEIIWGKLVRFTILLPALSAVKSFLLGIYTKSAKKT